MRGWMICFLLTIVVFGAQLSPTLGVFLMLVAAPAWSIVLINLGFLLMARDAIVGRNRRWLLVAPLLWFGGYFVVTSISHWQAHRYEALIQSLNAGKRVPFDPAAQDVIIQASSQISAQTLIDEYGLTRSYERYEDRARVVSYTSYVLTGMICPRSVVSHNYDGTTAVYTHPVDHFSGARELCLVSSSLAPERPEISVRLDPLPGVDGVNRFGWRVSLSSAGSALLTLRAGWQRPLSWFPLPVLGCGLDSGAPAWRCFTGFQHEWVSHDGLPSPLNVVTAALGLRRISIRQRFPNAGWN